MERKILSYSEFKNNKTLGENNDTSETADINEDLLSGIMSFFKGIFNLFGDKKVKERSKEITGYLDNGLDSDNEEGVKSKEDWIEDCDTKRVRKSFNSISSASKERIDIDSEQYAKKKLTPQDVTTYVTSWLGMIFVGQQSTKLPVIEKIIKDNNMSKRLAWVPAKYRKKDGSVSVDWYKQKECTVDKEILQGIHTVIKSPAPSKEQSIKKFAKAYIESVAKKNNIDVKDSGSLLDLLNGFASALTKVIDVSDTIIKNTNDDTIANTIRDNYIEEIKQTPKAKKQPNQKTEKNVDDKDMTDRSKRRVKETAKV